MEMQFEIDDEMFALLESYAGTETSDDAVIELAGEALECLGFTGLYYIEVPELNDSVLANWDRVDEWLDEFGGMLGEEVLPDGLPEDAEIYGDEKVTPLVIYGSLETFKQLAVQKKIERLQKEKSGVAYVECTNSGRVLNFVYDDIDLWAFDFYDRVKVLRDSDFTEENGYYAE